MRAAATTAVVAGTATVVSGGVRRHQEAKAEAQQAAAAPPPQAEAPAEDPYEALTKLAQLHDQGILTDEEFAAQKAKILG
jgi:hypothetical protein